MKKRGGTFFWRNIYIEILKNDYTTNLSFLLMLITYQG